MVQCFIFTKLASVPGPTVFRRRYESNTSSFVNPTAKAFQDAYDQTKKLEKEILKQQKGSVGAYESWLQDFHADCIPIEGRDDLVVLIVSREGVVTHTEVLAAYEDMDPTIPEERPLPYGRYRTSIEDIRPTKKRVIQGLNDMPASSLPQLLEVPSKQSQDTEHIEVSDEEE